MTTAPKVPPLTTLREAAERHGLDMAAYQRVYRLLKGREVLPNIFKRPHKFTVADMERAVAYDRSRHTPVPVRDDLVRCSCGRSWVSEEARAAHEARGECEVAA